MIKLRGEWKYGPHYVPPDPGSMTHTITLYDASNSMLGKAYAHRENLGGAEYADETHAFGVDVAIFTTYYDPRLDHGCYVVDDDGSRWFVESVVDPNSMKAFSVLPCRSTTVA